MKYEQIYKAPKKKKKKTNVILQMRIITHITNKRGTLIADLSNNQETKSKPQQNFKSSKPETIRLSKVRQKQLVCIDENEKGCEILKPLQPRIIVVMETP